MRVLGIDPGLVGAAAIFDAAAPNRAEFLDMPTMGDGAAYRVDAVALCRWVAKQLPDHCFIEAASSMPQQGVASTFRYGRAVGSIEAVIACMLCPLTLVHPVKWKNFYGLKRGNSVAETKERSRLRALQLVPGASDFLERKRDHGRAEALLIAYYGWRDLARTTAQPSLSLCAG